MNILYYIKFYLLLKRHEKIIWNLLRRSLPRENRRLLKKQFAGIEGISRRSAGDFRLDFSISWPRKHNSGSLRRRTLL